MWESVEGLSKNCFEVNLEWYLSPLRKKVDVDIKTRKPGFSRLDVDLNLFGDERCYSRLTSKRSIQFFDKLLIIKYASNLQYVVSCLRFLFNVKI